MKIIIQRVLKANVEVQGVSVGTIAHGALVFVGITHHDTITEVLWLANRLVNLRMFKDAQGKMNLSLLESQGEALIVSQFTLYGDCNAGRRPSFTQAAQPEIAKQLYEKFIEEVGRGGVKVQCGVFGAEMKVSLLNDGPVTFILERSHESSC